MLGRWKWAIMAGLAVPAIMGIMSLASLFDWWARVLDFSPKNVEGWAFFGPFLAVGLIVFAIVLAVGDELGL